MISTLDRLGPDHQDADAGNLLREVNAAMRESPAPALLETLQTVRDAVLSADPRALRRSVGWFGRLLGRDIGLQARAEARRAQLGVDVLSARRQLDALAGHRQRLAGLHDALAAAIETMSAQTVAHSAQSQSGDEHAQPAHADALNRRMGHLAALASSCQVTASHLDLTRASHDALTTRVAPLLARVDLLLQQDRMLQSSQAEHVALASALHAIDNLTDADRLLAPDAAASKRTTP